MKTSTKYKILADLLSGKEPTVKQLQKKYNLVNPRVHIMNLRAEGYPIYTKDLTPKKNQILVRKTRQYYYDMPPQAITAQAYEDLGAEPYLEYLNF